MDIFVHAIPQADFGGAVEMVEHKGAGHPDTMCDGLAEAFGQALARFYLERFGAICHFNVDKTLLVGGAARPSFGGGEVLAPIRVVLAGRATREVGGVRVPIDEIALETSRAWIRANMHALDPQRHMVWECAVRGGSSELVDLFQAGGNAGRGQWLANDTSLGAGYAPASTLEQVVLAAGDGLRQLAREDPEVGEDVKVMGLRRDGRIHLTVACAFIGKYLSSLDDYAGCKRRVADAVRATAERAACGEVAVDVNAADDLPSNRIYLTVTGTSAEAGDDGEVGRGNRTNRLITPYRPMSLEAAAGKNPVSHVGKLYSVAAQRLAAELVSNIEEVAEAQVFMLSCIGRPVNDPAVVDVRIRLHDVRSPSAIDARVTDLVRSSISQLDSIASELVAGRILLF